MEMQDGLLLTEPDSPLKPLAEFIGIRASHTTSQSGTICHRKEMQYPYPPHSIAELDALRTRTGHFLASLTPYDGNTFPAELAVRTSAKDGSLLWSIRGYDTLHDTAEHLIPILSMTGEIMGRHQERCTQTVRTAAHNQKPYIEAADAVDATANGFWTEALKNMLTWEDRTLELEAPQNTKARLFLDSLAENIGGMLSIPHGKETIRLAMGVREQTHWLLDTVQQP
jgi:hypothetical protein